MPLDATALPEYRPPASRRGTLLREGSNRTEHRYSLERGSNGTKCKWLTLVVLSRAASPSSLPLLYEGDAIEGRVELHLEQAETIKAVILSVQAGTTAVGQEEARFLTIQHTLWPAMGGQASARMKGPYYWPFNLTLPSSVVVPEPSGNGAKGEYRLPPSFSERASPAYIDYRIKVNVKRGMFKVDHP
ncbi:hypothetical protein HGRIS_003343 [Hohenbuehelia grisea]|uniref:Arrestin-like N-terminal domain-containing protein n=1 Tax=Hohenbuehelia grisea TaxID=104357 RepID=A0ABR3JF60_9AGAR